MILGFKISYQRLSLSYKGRRSRRLSRVAANARGANSPDKLLLSRLWHLAYISSNHASWLTLDEKAAGPATSDRHLSSHAFRGLTCSALHSSAAAGETSSESVTPVTCDGGSEMQASRRGDRRVSSV